MNNEYITMHNGCIKSKESYIDDPLYLFRINGYRRSTSFDIGIKFMQRQNHCSINVYHYIPPVNDCIKYCIRFQSLP